LELGCRQGNSAASGGEWRDATRLPGRWTLAVFAGLSVLFRRDRNRSAFGAHCLRLIGCLAALVMASKAGAGAPGTLLSSSTLSVKVTLEGEDDTRTFNPVVLPFSDTHEVFLAATHAGASYNFSNDRFEITIVHALDESPTTSATSEGSFTFTVAQDTRYELDGTYTTSGIHVVVQQAILRELGPSDIELFRNTQISVSTGNESFNLGEEGGNSDNTLQGSLVGLLSADVLYQFLYTALIDTFGFPPIGRATASGSFNLSLSPDQPSTECVGMLINW